MQMPPSSRQSGAAARSIRMVDLQRQYRKIKNEIDAAVQSVIDAGSFIKGPFVAKFEEELAAYLELDHAIGVGNGTDALQIAYMAAGVGPGSEIITTAFSFVATAEAAVVLGATPKFVDIDPKTFNIDTDQIEAHLSKKTRAIVPVHLFGRAANMDAVMEIAGRHGIRVIEDNAQAIGARYDGKPTGGIGDMGCISFFPSKNLGAFGDAGAVVTNDASLNDRVRLIANHGAKAKYHNEVPGLNSRLDALQAAVLSVKLAYLDAYTGARRQAADHYDDLLADVPGLGLPERGPEEGHVFHQYTVRIEGATGPERDEVARRLREDEIPCAVYYPVGLHRLPVMQSLFGAPPHLPMTESASAEVLSLPMHTELEYKDQQCIAHALETAMGG